MDVAMQMRYLKVDIKFYWLESQSGIDSITVIPYFANDTVSQASLFC